MRTLRTMLVVPFMMFLVLPSLAYAQERHAVDPAAIASTLSEHVAKQDADRAAVRDALTRPEVREVAVKAGIDLDRMVASVDTLSGNGLERAAEAARQVNDTLVGGASTVVISTTTIIIALLVVIIIILVAD